MTKEKEHRRRPRLNGRHLLTLGALSLMGLSGYELWIRFEDFWAWTSGIRHLSAKRGTPFIEDLAIIFEAPEMRQLGFKMLFLLFCILFSLICVIRRSRAKGAWVLILLDIAVAGVGYWLGLYSLNLTDWAQVLKLLPLLMILAGCVVNLIHRQLYRRRGRKAHEARAELKARTPKRRRGNEVPADRHGPGRNAKQRQ